MSTTVLAAILGIQALILTALLTIALDQHTHARVQLRDGLNRWGYRGAVARQRAHDETRLLFVGGTIAFEDGVALADTVAARLRYMTEQWVTFDRGPVTAFNLSVPGLPRGGYASRLGNFRYLSPDLICIYVDLDPPDRVAPAPGLTTRLTGYVPALSLWRETDLRLAGMLAPLPRAADDVSEVAEAVRVALSMARAVVVAVPVPTSARQRGEHDQLTTALMPFRGNEHVAVVPIQYGPPQVVADVLQPAAAVQLEPTFRRLLQARDRR